ncbi:tail protein [Klebsiella phage vB_Kpl_K59PH2]|uniref:Tail protein n=1 Tax=Klebsiella phage vB_Kpl_K59PH2 TaxID=3071671 RepID=A0AAD2GR34_9CAUD|nr:tail protein [Klebsiella phage vB_Kpl_K59PH2]
MDKSTSAWASAMVTEPDYVTMVTVTADGTTDQYEFNFPGDYLNRSDIKAYMLDEATAIRTDLTVTFVGPTLVKLTPAQPAGVKVTIYRDTPKELPLVDFTDGAMIEARNLDRNAKQCTCSTRRC